MNLIDLFIVNPTIKIANVWQETKLFYLKKDITCVYIVICSSYRFAFVAELTQFGIQLIGFIDLKVFSRQDSSN